MTFTDKQAFDFTRKGIKEDIKQINMIGQSVK